MPSKITAPTLIYRKPDGVLYEITPAKNYKYKITAVDPKSGKVLKSGYMPLGKVSTAIEDCKYAGLKGAPDTDVFEKSAG